MNKHESLALDIYRWCKKNDLWGDNIIYFDNKAWSSSSKWHDEIGRKIDEDLYEYENKSPLTYFEYANPKTLSMSFEGSLYRTLNGYTSGWMKKEAELQKLFKKYGYFFEYGNAWNLSAFE